MSGLQRWSRGWRADALAVGGIVLVGALFLHEMAVMSAVPVARDLQLFFIPHKHLVWSALQSADLPLWTPLIRTGYPVLANFQSGVFYPPHWLYAVLPFFTAFNLLIVLHLVLGGTGTYVLTRQLDLPRIASFLAALCFMLGGYFVSLVNLVNVLQTAAWAPLMAAVLVRHAEAWRARTFALTVAVYLLGFLAGAPQTFALAALTALALALAWCTGRYEESPRRWARVPVTLVGASVAVLGLAAVQVLPTLEMIGLSGRGTGLALAEAGQFSLRPVRLLHLAVPNAFEDPAYRFGQKLQLSNYAPWLYSIYFGVPALVLAWHSRWSESRRHLVVTCVALSAVGIVLSLGLNAPLFPWLHGNAPGMDAFRFPAKFFLMPGLAVPVLVGIGASELLRRPRLDAIDAGAALAALAAGLGLKLAWTLIPGRVLEWLEGVAASPPWLPHVGFFYEQYGEKIELFLAFLAASVALTWLYRKGKLASRLFLAAMVGIVVLDFWVAHRGLNPVVDPSFYRDEPLILDQLPVDELRREHRYRATPFDASEGTYYDYDQPLMTSKWFWQQTLQPPITALWGLQAHDAAGAIVLNPIRVQRLAFEEMEALGRARLLRLGSVSQVYATLPNPALRNARWRRLDSLPGVLHTLEDPLPRAYLAHGRTFRDEWEALDFALRPGTHYRREAAILSKGAGRARRGLEDSVVARIAPSRSAAVEPPTVEPSTVERPSDPGTARIASDAGETIRIDVDVREPSYLVLTDTWYPGWRATVDGDERPVRRANYFFKAVRVRPGDGEVVFRYRSSPLRRGALVSGGSLLLLLVGLAGWRVRDRA